MKRIVSCVLAVAGVAPAMGAGAAEDDSLCYEIIGCVHDRKIDVRETEQLGCEQLWTVRNGIFHARGYCFKTDRGREAFGNAGCRYDDEAAVPLNDYERANVQTIRDAESHRGC